MTSKIDPLLLADALDWIARTKGLLAGENQVMASAVTGDNKIRLVINFGKDGGKFFEIDIADLYPKEDQAPEQDQDSASVPTEPEPTEQYLPEGGPDESYSDAEGKARFDLIPGVSEALCEKVWAAGYLTWSDVDAASDTQLLEIQGLGFATLLKVRQFLEEING